MIERDWIDTMNALATPAIALFAAIFAGGQVWNEHRRRKNDLFDRRLAFYKQLEGYWLGTHEDNVEGAPGPAWFDVEYTVAFTTEADFLFGPEIARHVRSLQDRRHTGHPNFPDESFVKPFRKFLSLR